MIAYIYYWPDHDVHCTREDLESYVANFGHNYSSHIPVDFYNTIGKDIKDD